MYFWHVDRLVEDFRNDKVSEKEKLKYMVLMGILIVIISDPIMYIDSKYSLMDSISLPLMIVTTILGIYYCYAKNKTGDNKDFITRFICLGLPVGIRVSVFMIPFFILVLIVDEAYGVGRQFNKLGEEVYVTTISQVILGILIEIIYYIYLGKKLKEIGQKNGYGSN